MWRQGDVLIQSVSGIPVSATPKIDLLLAEGEVTGHAHRIADAETAELYQHGDILFLNVLADSATILHEEHAPIELERGIYRVWRQREYVPGRMKTRRVRD